MHKVLVIEDEPIIRELICNFLKINDIDCIEVSNATDAINELNIKHVDLVLCDINLPDISGYEILKHIRGNTSLTCLPFIFISAFADTKEIENAKICGADDYITKPFTYKTFVSKVKAFLINV